jgi:hypothetical protein
LKCISQKTVMVCVHFLTHSWSWALLEKLPIVQLLKNFPAFYGTRRFITVFTRALHWSLSWARSIQFPSLLFIWLLSSRNNPTVELYTVYKLWQLKHTNLSFNQTTLPLNFKHLSNSKKFKTALKEFLQTHIFYTVDKFISLWNA